MSYQTSTTRPRSAPLDRSAVGIATVVFFGWLAVLATMPMGDAPFRSSSLFLGCNAALSAILT